jgi:hypothetical protein
MKNISLFKKQQTINSLEAVPDWVLVSRSYAAPRRDLNSIASLPESVIQKALLGVTTYLWEDKNSGKLRKEEILGNDRDELADLCEKVDITGNMQIIRIDGKTYGIAKWAPPREIDNSLPVK